MRTLSRLALVGMIGGGAAACSTDASRLADPFTNHFASNEPAATGSLPDAPAGGVTPIRTGRIQSEALAAPGVAPRPVSSLARASQTPLPAATRVASTGAAGWSAQGGTPVTVGQGDGLSQMSTRFGVPASAILSANGLTSASQVTPGRQIVIPVYNASGMNPAAMSARTEPAPLKAIEKKTDKVVEERRAEDKIAEREARKEAAHKKELAEQKAEAKKTAETKKADAKKDMAEAKKDEAAKRHVRPGQTAKAETETKVDPKAEAARKKEAEAKLASAKAAKDSAKADAARKLAEAKAARENSEKVAKAETAAPAPKAEIKTAQAKAPEPASTGSVAAASDQAFRWPAKGRVISGYGSSGNEGINIAVPEGTAVKAAEDGTVAYAGSDVKGYGKLVLVRHPNGYVSAYAHNGELDVKPGEKVKRGQTIAKSGASGNVTSPQLHFEIRKGGAPVDPMSQLASN